MLRSRKSHRDFAGTPAWARTKRSTAVTSADPYRPLGVASSAAEQRHLVVLSPRPRDVDGSRSIFVHRIARRAREEEGLHGLQAIGFGGFEMQRGAPEAITCVDIGARAHEQRHRR